MAPPRYPGRELLADLASPLGGLASLFLAAALVLVRGDRWRPIIIVVLLAPVGVSAVLGGLRSGLVSALVASLSFNFFHVPPYGLLKLGVREVAFAVLFVLPALLLAKDMQPQPPGPVDDGSAARRHRARR